jgi:hypothetical protein
VKKKSTVVFFIWKKKENNPQWEFLYFFERKRELLQFSSETQKKGCNQPVMQRRRKPT